jgi:hypothetical protein
MFIKKLIVLSVLILAVACQESPTKPDTTALYLNEKYTQIIQTAESRATPAGRKVLTTGREISLINKEHLRGSCWDYANTVYNRAGFSTPTNREVILQSTKSAARPVNPKTIQPGDFLSYINHSYGNSEHSAIFVDWVDENRKTALMLSYAGENRAEPARYRIYDLSNVYFIMRPRS